MRFNLLGGPGAGKSETALRLAADIKHDLRSVEHVGEYVKSWAYQKRTVEKFDQVYIFGKQHQYEYRFISSGVKNIITDSPVFLSSVYAPSELALPLTALCMAYDREFPSMNIFIQRGDKPYLQAGRWQTKDEALELDKRIFDMAQTYCTKVGVPFRIYKFQEYDKILDLVRAYCD